MGFDIEIAGKGRLVGRFLAKSVCDSLAWRFVTAFVAVNRIAGGMGKPRERHETGEQDLFRARLDQILNMKHELVRLARNRPGDAMFR